MKIAIIIGGINMENNNQTSPIQNLLDSDNFYASVKKVSDKFNLHVDQFGELYAEIRDVIRKVSKSSDFITHIIGRLEINEKLANQIAEEVNKEIFAAIKSTMEHQESSISAIERVGGFSVEKEKVEETNGKEVTPADKAKILEGIENPRPNRPHADIPMNGSIENHTEPLVDYLLTNPIAQAEKKVVVETNGAAPQQKVASRAEPRKQGPDPYRELPN